MKVEFKCLKCGERFTTPNHVCILATCRWMHHFDWCRKCQASNMVSFEKQFKVFPVRKLRVEEVERVEEDDCN